MAIDQVTQWTLVYTTQTTYLHSRDNNVEIITQWTIMSKDPYLDFLNTDSLLFGSSSKSIGKDPLKFTDPLSFGTSDPLSFGASDPLSFSLGNDKKGDKKKDKEEIAGGDVDAESHHSDDEASAPPIDYLGYIQVVAYT